MSIAQARPTIDTNALDSNDLHGDPDITHCRSKTLRNIHSTVGEEFLATGRGESHHPSSAQLLIHPMQHQFLRVSPRHVDNRCVRRSFFRFLLTGSGFRHEFGQFIVRVIGRLFGEDSRPNGRCRRMLGPSSTTREERAGGRTAIAI